MSTENKKPILFTGITATGTLTLGHYFGVIQHLIKLQEKYQIFMMVADLHALTTITERRVDYNAKAKEIASLVYASGLKEENCKVFIQSQVKGHLELAHYLSSYCSVGKASNMIQYKEKSRGKQNASLSLLTYPALMASDILLYDADLVIVGKDQKQHLELTTYIANKFNADNNNCLKIPEYSIPEFGSKIMGLRDPQKKMSKSGNDFIALLETEESIESKIMKAETDSEGKVYFDPENKPGVSNLLTIYSRLKDITIKESQEHFSKSNYSELKSQTISEVKKLITKIQSKFNNFYENIDLLLDNNNKLLNELSEKKLSQVRKQINLWNANLQ